MSNTIDTIAASEGLIDFIEQLKLLAHDEILPSDYRVHTVDINLEDYFNEELNYWDKMHHIRLDPTRKGYQLKFTKALKE